LIDGHGLDGVQDREGHALQIEGDLTFQRGQVQQSYIGTVCGQLQRHIGNYLAPDSAWQAVPQGVGEGAVHLVLTLVAVQADMLRLAPHSCITQVCGLSISSAHCALLCPLHPCSGQQVAASLGSRLV